MNLPITGVLDQTVDAIIGTGELEKYDEEQLVALFKAEAAGRARTTLLREIGSHLPDETLAALASDSDLGPPTEAEEDEVCDQRRWCANAKTGERRLFEPGDVIGEDWVDPAEVDPDLLASAG